MKAALISVLFALFAITALHAAEPALEPALKKERVNPNAAPPRQPAAGVKFSEAVRENDVEFEAFALPNWPALAGEGKSKIEIGLRVSNKAAKAMQFNVFDTMHVVLRDANGKEMARKYMRDATRLVPPMLIDKGESATLFFDATLQGGTLTGFDNSGGVWSLEGLKPGKYTLTVVYACEEKVWERVKSRPTKAVVDPQVAPFWSGKFTTKDLAIEIAPPAAANAGQ